MWKEQISWDEVPTKFITNEGSKIRSELNMLNDLIILRWVNYDQNDNFELHGFSDASEVAYAAVIYLKNVSKNTICLFVAKTRVAPLKNNSKVRVMRCNAACEAHEKDNNCVGYRIQANFFVVRFENYNRLDKRKSEAL